MEEVAAVLGDEIARNAQMHIGYRGHLLTFPIEKRADNESGCLSKEDGKSDKEEWVLPMKRERMYQIFEGWGPKVRPIMSLMRKPDVWAPFNPTLGQKRTIVVTRPAF